MHDIDSAKLEFESDLDQFESDPYELSPYDSGEAGVLSDADEMELAADLLATGDEQELDQYLGKLIGQAGEVAGKPVKGKVGSKLGGFLKGALKKLLPTVAGAAGTLVGGPVGGVLASKAASAAGKAFGLELEGMSPEDQEFETARRFVRFAAEAAKQAGGNGPTADAQGAARKAVIEAAKKYAPGLLRAAGKAVNDEVAPPRSAQRPGQSGRWVRDGQKIVLLGL